MSDKNRIQCKFCNWSTVKAFKTKDGKFNGPDKAQQRLVDHCEQYHPDEIQKVREQIGDHEDPDLT